MQWIRMTVALALLASAALSGCSSGKGAGPGPRAEKPAAVEPVAARPGAAQSGDPAVVVDLHYKGLPADSQEVNA